MGKKVRTVRFSDEKNAMQFATNVGGLFMDLRGYPVRKSDFKVKYEPTMKPRTGPRMDKITYNQL